MNEKSPQVTFMARPCPRRLVKQVAGVEREREKCFI